MGAVRHIFRWDLDKTYLKTDFDSVRELVRTARASAEQRENIPGSAALIRAIRDLAPEGGQDLIYFISGSPRQLRTVLEKKFELDGFHPDGFILKPVASEIFRGRFRSVRGQIAYKLGALLSGRGQAPIGSKETLVGDDAESDVFIYSLYADLVRGRVPRDTLVEVLRRSGAYRDQVDFIMSEMEAIVHENVVRRVVIHLDQQTPPAYFTDYFPRVVPIYNHLQTALILALDETVDVRAVRAVTQELLVEFEFEGRRLVQLAEDIFRRLRTTYPTGALDQLADRLEASDEYPNPPRRPATVNGIIGEIAERARFVSGRPLPKQDEGAVSALDYLDLYDKDEERREEARRLKKLAKEQAEEQQKLAKRAAKR